METSDVPSGLIHRAEGRMPPHVRKNLDNGRNDFYYEILLLRQVIYCIKFYQGSSVSMEKFASGINPCFTVKCRRRAIS